MKNQRNKTKGYTLALVLALTIATTFIASVPLTSGQTKLSCTIAAHVVYDPIGVGQTQMVRSTCYPVLYSIDHVYTIFRPDGTNFTMTASSEVRAQEAYVEFVCDQEGVWRVEANWGGDATHFPARGGFYNPNTLTWICWSAPVQQPPDLIETTAVVSTTPDKVGTGDYIYIVGWLHPPREYITAIYPEFRFVITKPDGSTETRIEQPESPATSSFAYPCTQAGEYSVVMEFPGYYIHEPATSPTWTWTVEDGYEVPVWPSEPLPTGEWGYPISLEYRDWYQISGPWFGDGFNTSQSNFNPYTKAPNTPHILWRMQMSATGITGGAPDFGGGGWTGYSGRGPTCCAAQGKIYFTTTESWVTSDGLGSRHPVLWCVDQFTGEVIYKKNLPGGGGAPYIELTQRIKIDPETAEVDRGNVFSLWLVSGGLMEIDPFTGEVSYWNPDIRAITATFYYDSAVYLCGYPNATAMTKWDCRSKQVVWTNNDMQTLMDVGNTRATEGGWIGAFPLLVWKDTLVSVQIGTGGYPYNVVVRSWNTTDGAWLAKGDYEVDVYASGGAPPCGFCVDDGKVYVHCQDRRTHAVNVYTGQEVWVSDQMDYPWGYYVAYNAAAAYGNVIEQSWDGHLYAYNTDTGATSWVSDYTGDTTETAMGTYAWWGQLSIADGKIYGATDQHTQPSPVVRGDRLYCVDAYTGDFIWSLPWQGGQGGISSGMLYFDNEYDGCLYSFGKGPTATTVSAPQTTITAGSSILVQGTVTDQSPGSKDTPAIADENMEEWMEYLYMQKPIPAATGVPVLLQAVQPDGTVIDIGWVTSDMTGQFSTLWTPPEQSCTYSIVATFMGTESYWPSYAQTAIAVLPAPEAPSEPTEEPAYTTIDLAIIAAVVVAIIIGIVNLWALRKRS